MTISRVIACMLPLTALGLGGLHQGPDRGDAVTLYVDDDAPLGGDGLAWVTAFRHFQDALEMARRTPGVREIRLAEGTYKPDQGRGQTLGDRYSTFTLVSGTSVRGSYAGMNARDPNARDIEARLTILSGDLLGNDGPNFANYADNAYRVTTGMALSPDTLLEGMRFQSSNIETDNALEGGGLYCFDGGISLEHCTFAYNRAYRGGGIGALGVDLRIRRCAFVANTAGDGAGIYGGTSPGGIPSLVLLEDSVFNGNNTASYAGDGAAIKFAGSGEIRRCVFANNVADDGAVSFHYPIQVIDSVFRSNYADYSAAAHRSGVYVRCLFENNLAAVAGGAYGEQTSIESLHARFLDCTFVNNSTNGQGGGACSGGKEFANCRFIGNEAGLAGGGPFAPGGAIHARVPTRITNCEFSGNAAPGVGGAIAVNAGIPVTISNSTFTNNHSEVTGEGVAGPATICNSVFSEHDGPPLSGVTSVDYSCLPPAFPFGGGTGNIAADPRFVDPLGPDGIAGTEDDDLRLRPDSPCIDAGDSTALPPDQFDLDGDGDTAEPLPVDILGNRRVLFAPPHASPPDVGVPDATGAIIDMGAFEFRRPIDCAPPTPPIGDGFVNIDDLLLVISGWGDCPKPPAACLADVNADGAVNIDDLLAVVTAGVEAQPSSGL